MMKFPWACGGGTVPSGNSVAVTYPGVCGSRVGGVGRAGCVAGDERVVAGAAGRASWAIAGRSADIMPIEKATPSRFKRIRESYSQLDVAGVIPRVAPPPAA